MLPEDRPNSDHGPWTKDEAKKICGTPRYIAPEVYGLDSDGWYSYEADIFSFGVILYELLHGKVRVWRHHGRFRMLIVATG